MALRRVDGGGMARAGGAYFDRGRPTPGHLTGVFDQLVWAGLVTVAEGDALWELRRMSLTDTGKARYAVLSERLDPGYAVPPLAFGITPKTPVGRRREPLPPAPGDRSGPIP
ncbi:MAG: hypothetical protein ACRDTC_01195 [Pseudonocardiaceae bacterium]